jgi:hypothetical protein
MKIETTTIREQKIRIHSLTGEFDFDMLFQTLVDVYTSPQFDPVFNSIWDFSKVKNLQRISMEQLEKMVAYVAWKRSRLGKTRTAIVVSGEVDLGLAKMYEREMEATNMVEISIFSEVDDALGWLKE